MGADIHWYIERKKQDGSWVPVQSQAFTYIITEGEMFSDPGEYFKRPEMRLGERNYDFFSIMSNVRRDKEPFEQPGRQIAHEGLPDDAHPIVVEDFLGDGDLHSESWITLGEFRTALVEAPFVHHRSEYRRVLQERLDCLEHLLALPPRIHFGRRYNCGNDIHFPEMRSVSAHKRIDLLREAETLLPVTDMSARLILAYDN